MLHVNDTLKDSSGLDQSARTFCFKMTKQGAPLNVNLDDLIPDRDFPRASANTTTA